MRDYGRIYSTFWSSETTGSMSDDGKLLAAYLMTCSHSTIAGVFRLPDGYVAEDLGWSSERVQKGFDELLAKGFANRCGTTKWVWVLKHLEWNKPENPNQRKSAAKVASGIPRDCCWGPDFMRVCGEVLALSPRSDWNPSGTVPKPLANQEQEQEQEQKKENTPNPLKGARARVRASTDPQPGFDAFWEAWPKHRRKGGKADCLKAWRKRELEPFHEQIVAHVEFMKASDDWRRDGGQYIPAPVVYLNKSRWDGAEIADANEGRAGLWEHAV